MFRLDLPEIANGVWGIFDDLVPEDEKIRKADALIDLIVNDYNDLDGYREMATYCEYDCLRVAAENNVNRIKEEANEKG